MEENRIANVEIESDSNGKVTFSPDVVATIVGLAVAEVNGVANMVGQGSIKDMLRLNAANRTLTKGVKIDIRNTDVFVNLTITVDYGVPIPQIVKDIQESVKKNVETMTGLSVPDISIYVSGISFEKEKSQQAALTAPETAALPEKTEAPAEEEAPADEEAPVEEEETAEEDAPAEEDEEAEEEPERDPYARMGDFLRSLKKRVTENAGNALKTMGLDKKAQPADAEQPDEEEEAGEVAEQPAEEIIEETAETVEETVEETAETVEEAVEEAAEETAETVEEAVEEPTETVEEAVEEPTETVEEAAEEPAPETDENN